MSKIVIMAFVLMAVLMLVVYYVGLQSDLAAITEAVGGLAYYATGRNSSGQFASIPASTPTPKPTPKPTTKPPVKNPVTK